MDVYESDKEDRDILEREQELDSIMTKKVRNKRQAEAVTDIGNEGKKNKQMENIVEANRYLSIEAGLSGVIFDWNMDMPLHELVEAIDDTQGILQLVRMRKRYLDPQTKEAMIGYTHNILVTIEGNELPKELKLLMD
ncbi:hypothetical protein X777_01109 [Ooceraea biroi]|uniref:Uncharacterized protein n=1 Tax=Ooceraea biroi TaxID=2015173 RepID=A0A026WR83_OOCBI|nr:hypothetical protein X777_01109 [Ooceraea biroi]